MRLCVDEFIVTGKEEIMKWCTQIDAFVGLHLQAMQLIQTDRERSE